MIKKNIGCLIISVFAMILTASSSSAQEKTLAITPFTVTSESGLGYLENGLIDLFASRLALEKKVLIADKARVIELFSTKNEDPQAMAAEIFGKIHADYVVTGSLLESAKGVVLKVLVYEPAKEKPMLDLSEASGELDATDSVIPLVNRVCNQINRDLFYRKVKEDVAPQPLDRPYNIYAHPDTLLEFVPKEAD